jgi:hypothetical protein
MVDGTFPAGLFRTGLFRTGRFRAGICLLGVSLATLAAPVAAAEPDSPDPATQVVAESDPAVVAAPADGVPHLPSPDNLPPGTTGTPAEGSNTSYLRYLWQAIRTPGITMSDALILIAQRPMDAPNP